MRRVQGSAPIVSLAVAAVAGAAATLAPFLPNGLVLTGSACGGGGSEQQCIGIARQLSLVEVSPRAWFFVAGGVLVAVLAGAAIVALHRGWAALVAITLVLAVVALVGIVSMERVAAYVEPAGTQGTIGRLLEDWHPFLEPELADMREDAVRTYAGQPTVPGGPLYDREQILDSFSVREQGGWKLLRWAIPVALFAALGALASLLVASLALAVTLAGTTGLVVWALAYDRARPCDSNASECYDGFVTIFAVGAAVVWWVAYLLGVSAERRGDRSA
jgi:uncharacterized protein YdbL (DUF1318 family)